VASSVLLQRRRAVCCTVATSLVVKDTVPFFL
jgi:hypothetical protein